MPVDTTLQTAQGTLNRVHVKGDVVIPKKRAYKKEKFGDILKNGPEIHNRLISDCRLIFIRYVSISDSMIPERITAAAGYTIDRNTLAYDQVYGKVLSWRKNWYTAFLKASADIQSILEEEHPVLRACRDDAELKAGYAEYYNWEYIHRMFQEIFANLLDWRETLKTPGSAVWKLYKNIFIYTMLYLHQNVHDAHKYPRPLQLKKIKLIAHHPDFESVSKKDYIRMPEKPTKRARYIKPQATSILQLDEEFSPV